MRLSENDKTIITDILSENIVIGISKNNKDIWDCTGLETQFSKEEKIAAYFKNFNIESIVSKILKWWINEQKEIIEK